MQHLSILEMAKRGARGKICPHCYQRPLHSETLPPEIARSCEPQCTLFIHMPKMATLVAEGATLACAADEIVHTIICQTCRASPTAGDFCSDRLARTCPLSRYGAQLIEILERLRQLPAEARPA